MHHSSITCFKRTRTYYWGMAVLIVALSSAVGLSGADEVKTTKQLPASVIERFGPPPEIPLEPSSDDIKAALQVAFVDSVTAGGWGRDQTIAMQAIAESGDPRLGWLIADLMRFASQPQLMGNLAAAATELLGIEFENSNIWGKTTDHLIAWDLPAPEDYLEIKRAIFTSLVPGWDALFVPGNIDWRHVSWGGVLIDDRAFDTTDELCNCIPAADNPAVTKASETQWLKNSDIVFGVVVNGEARAYPRRIMEVREMVNDTLGGRNLGIPYCTLCGSAQAYFTDQLPENIKRPILRTSGLLIRSNKVMYDIESQSVFDTFTGEAVTGPLAKKKLVLQQASVVTAEWGEWKKQYPDTTVLDESLALGRDFDFRNNRDADGPIFPIGDVDPRLSVHEDIIGIVSESGVPVAFPRSTALVALTGGQSVEYQNVRLVLDGGGIKAVDAQGADLGSHQAFWFAWSQFYPDTKLWPIQ